MKSLLITTLFIQLLVGWHAAAAKEREDTTANREAAADRYLNAVSMVAVMQDMIDKTSQRMPLNQRQQFINCMNDYVRVDTLEEAARASMVRHFTAEELNALADFYGSPEGRSAMKKFGAYMADVMPAVRQEMNRAMRQYQSEHPAE